eukprot:CAMPEP_0182504846 /NCGR_PEP_ID=MMETSP1321-20130603/17983_1 /TAXON_ID=91990 /ORGANISM="Bolidomonas sp., Strain RCC1657" /LENGTH=31 /DNA_ID= /DNA_START= /DNA_END= /DNA_ORIENTATION=
MSVAKSLTLNTAPTMTRNINPHAAVFTMPFA